MRKQFRFATAAATALLLCSPAEAQPTRLNFAGQPTNLLADFSQLFWAPSSTGSFFLLAPFGGTTAQRYPFGMFRWNGHPMMQAWFPGGWWEVRFSFPQWAYLAGAPCAMQAPPHLPTVHGGIDSTYDYGPPLFTGPITGIHQPLPGWVLGTSSVPWVGGNSATAIDETFALFLEDYFLTSLTACTGGTPVDWVAVEVNLSLIPH